MSGQPEGLRLCKASSTLVSAKSSGQLGQSLHPRAPCGSKKSTEIRTLKSSRGLRKWEETSCPTDGIITMLQRSTVEYYSALKKS